MSDSHTLLQRIALAAAVVAATPYTVLKVLWLTGSTIGMTSSAGSSEMSGARFVVGNSITVVLILLAVSFLVALTRPWAHRVPAPVVFVLGAGGTGLLAPILLGLPLGLLVQAVVSGDVRPADKGLAPWVFGIVYSGFGVLALAMVVIVAVHVVQRWRHLLARPPTSPAPWARLAGAVGLLPFAAAMTVWSVLGPGESGPQGMTLPAQRTVLLVTAVLSIAALVTPLLPTHLTRRRPRLAWLVTWTGCCVAALQGPTQVLLAQDGEMASVAAAIGLLATAGACTYGLAILREHLATPDRPAAERAPGGTVHADTRRGPGLRQGSRPQP